MDKDSLPVILFELLILRKIQVGLGQFSSISKDVPIYIEVSNSVENKLRKKLKYLERF